MRVRAALRLATGFRGRPSQDAELDEELAFHVAQATQHNIDRGMRPQEARRAALVALGGRAQWTEAARDEQRSRWLDDAARDLRYGWAALLRNPGFTAGGVLTIALAIAATTTVFNFVSAVYLRSLDVPEGPRLVHIRDDVPATQSSHVGFPAFLRLRERTRTLDAVVAHYSTAPLYVTARGESGEIPGAVVSAGYFGMLGLRPALGRFFAPSEDSVRDRDAVAVIGHGLWRTRFGAESGVIGEHLTINGRSFTIIGVAPPGFTGVLGGLVNELWIPAMMLHVGYRYCDGFEFTCAVTGTMARLAPGTTLGEAQAELDGLYATLVAGADTAFVPHRIVATPALGIRDQEQLGYRGLSQLLWAIALALFAVACANLGGLLLSRGMARRREFALRASLGAGRGRIVRQLLTESLLLGLVGGAAGIALTIVTSRALASFLVDGSRRIALPLDGSVLRFVAVATLVTVVLFGLFPALHVSKVDVAEALKAADTRPRSRARQVLLAGQAVLAVVLLVAAGLLSRSFVRATAGGPLDPAHLAEMRLRPNLVGYPADRSNAYFREAIERIRATPGVVAASLNRWSISVRWTGGSLFASLPGEPVPTDRSARVNYMEVGDGYFEMLHFPMLAGREFNRDDTPSTPHVALVNESLARRLWHSLDVLGRSVVLAGESFQVVGVVKDYRPSAFGEPPLPTAYVAFWQMRLVSRIDTRVGIRFSGDPGTSLVSVRRALASIDPSVPVVSVASMEELMRSSFAEVRLGGVVLLTSSALTLFLAAVGLYGVVSYLVTQRSREIAVRLAIGAKPREVVAMLVRQGVRPILIGGAIGLVLSLAAAPLLGRWLFGIAPTDPLTIGGAFALVLLVAVAGSGLPAWRAAATDPAAAFRAD